MSNSNITYKTIWTITNEQVEIICPKCYRALIGVMMVENWTLDKLAIALKSEEDSIPDVVALAFHNMQMSFARSTNLILGLEHHTLMTGLPEDQLKATRWTIKNRNVKNRHATEFERKFGEIKPEQHIEFNQDIDQELTEEED